ncbi:UNVERIFIED_CONTAM: Photosystem I chlorophyll a apoprotein A1 [Sesamum angustifolium]|uniref:Photosystem I chlorophyll a apoprotein A1 n=1 Tax=Sesamum angustifolium TaxID=2727405 RepID=A0AAW2KKV1_9LAMI
MQKDGDFDGHTSDLEEISRKVFSAHFGQLSIIFLWLSGMYFHGARFSNYEAWLSDPTHIGPSAQVVWPIVGQEILNALMLFAGWFHYHKAAPKLAWFQDVESMLNHHLAGLLGLGGSNPIFTLNWSKYADFLTFRGGLDPVTGGLWLTDIAHHHLAIAILFLIAGHMYRTNWGIGHGLKDILEAHKGPFTGQGHKGLYEILTTSWHAQLSLNLAMLGSLTIVVAHHMYSMPPYPYLATDYGTQLSLFTHHMWIGGFLIVGAAAHAAIFMSDVWGSISDQGVVTHITGGNFAQSSITINGWLRDFLWAQASQDPLHVRPIAHAIWDPHFGKPAVEAFTRGGALGPVNIAYSGVYQWWYTIGLRTNEDLYTGALFLLFLSAISLIAGWLHLQPKWKPSVSWFKNAESRLNHHLSGLFGVSSLAWTGHLVHVAIPGSRGEYVRWNNFLDVLPG